MEVRSMLYQCENPHCGAYVPNRIHVDALGHICGRCFHELPAAREQFTRAVVPIEAPLQRARRARPSRWQRLVAWFRGQNL
jgi:hypothetical protein